MHKDPVERRTHGPDPARSIEATWRPAPFRGFPPDLKPRGYLTSAVHLAGHYFSLLG